MASGISIATLAAVLTLDVAEFSKGASKAADDVKGLGDKVAGFAPIAAAGFAAAGAAIVGVGAALYSVGSEFDAAYDKLRVGTGKTGEQLEHLKDVVKGVATEVPASFDEASTAVTMLSERLNLNDHQLQMVSDDFLELSRVTGTDLSENIKNITRVFGDWSITDTSQAMNEMFRATQLTGVGIDKLTQEVVQFGAPLRGLGFGFEESLAMLGKWEKEGVNVENVMGAMRKAYGTFSKEFGAKAPEEFRKFVAELSKAPTASAAAAMAIEKLGVRNGPDFAAAVKEGRFAYADLVDGITNGSDTIMSAAEDTADFGEKWQVFTNKLKVAAEPLANEVFGAVGRAMDALSPIAETAAKWLGEQLPKAIDWLKQKWDEMSPGLIDGANHIKDAFTPMADKMKETFQWLIDNEPAVHGAAAGAAAAIGVVLAGAFVALGTAAWGAASGVIAATWPIFAIAAAVGAVVGILVWAYNNWDTFRNVVNTVVDWLKSNVPQIFDQIKNAVLEFYNVALAPLISFIQEHSDAFANLGKALLIIGGVILGVLVVAFLAGVAAVAAFIGIAALVIVAVGALIAFLYNLAQVFWDVFQNVKDAVATAFHAVVDFIGGIPEKIGGVISAIVGFVTELPGRILAAAAALPGILASAIVAVFDWVTTEIGFSIGRIVRFFMDLPGNIMALAGFLWDVITTVFTTAKDLAIGAVTWLFNTVIDFFTQLPGRAAAVLSFLWGAISGAFNWAKDQATSTVSNLAESVLNFLRDLPGRAAGALSGFAGTVGDKLREAVDKAKDIGGDIVRGVADGITGAVGWVIDAAKRAAGNIISGFKSALGISSPSKEMAEHVGRWIPAGIADGILHGMGPLRDATNAIVATVMAVKKQIDLAGAAREALDAMNAGIGFTGEGPGDFTGMSQAFASGGWGDRLQSLFFAQHPGQDTGTPEQVRAFLESLAGPAASSTFRGAAAIQDALSYVQSWNTATMNPYEIARMNDYESQLRSGLASQARQQQTAQITFSGDTDSAFATAFQKMVRTGQIQITAA